VTETVTKKPSTVAGQIDSSLAPRKATATTGHKIAINFQMLANQDNPIR
jgi:hypothetical protein